MTLEVVQVWRKRCGVDHWRNGPSVRKTTKVGDLYLDTTSIYEVVEVHV